MKRRGFKEIGGLFILFALLVGFAAFYEQVGQERVASNAPTTTNAQSEGVRALYLLYSREGFPTDILRSPWSDLARTDGLLVFVEPPVSDRLPDREDLTALEKWIRGGGTLLDLVADPPVEQPFDSTNAITGDCGATAGPSDLHEVPVDSSGRSPLVAGVQNLSVISRQRLKLVKNAPYTVLARDANGIVAVEKTLGSGRVILVANRYGATNGGIAQADNAIFLVNIARVAATNGRSVRFDEYHHGLGFSERSTSSKGGVWASTPLPLRLGFMHLVAAGLLLLYNGNRRFGPVRVSRKASTRASTDYVTSMARLYRRAGASDIAVETLYARFVRDLKRALDLPADISAVQLGAAAEKRYGNAVAGLPDLLFRGEGVIAGLRVTEADMLKLAQQIEHFRRACQLVGV